MRSTQTLTEFNEAMVTELIGSGELRCSECERSDLRLGMTTMMGTNACRTAFRCAACGHAGALVGVSSAPVDAMVLA
jgi:hypothetical protein